MAFSKGEERLIEATIPVIKATADVLAANAAYAEAGQAAAAVAQAEFGEDSEVESDHFHDMLMEAGRRAGFDPGDHVMAVIEQSFAEYFLMEQLIEDAHNSAARDVLLEGTGVEH